MNDSKKVQDWIIALAKEWALRYLKSGLVVASRTDYPRENFAVGKTITFKFPDRPKTP